MRLKDILLRAVGVASLTPAFERADNPSQMDVFASHHVRDEVASAVMADLVILGATPGGIMAAISATRLNKTSVIVERTPYIGGLPANGLGATDIKTKGATGGLFLEFVGRIEEYYVETYGAGSEQVKVAQGGYHFEPHVAEKVFHEWLAEYPQIKVLINRQFDFEPENVEIQKDTGTLQSIRVTNRETQDPETISGRFFLDATYEGDLIAASGVPFFLGREGKEIYGELGAGRLYKYWNGGEMAGSTGSGDNAVQSYNYRLCVTNDPENQAKVQKPASYNREEYASLVYDVKSGLHTGNDVVKITPEMIEENLKRAEQNLPPVPNKLPGISRIMNNVNLPNRKVDGNNQHFAFLSTDLPEENWPYPTSSWDWRDSFAKRLREYTQGLLYFAQNDPELPQWFRDQVLKWGWAADEYLDNDHFPRQLYVREGRRMRGKYIFSANDVPINDQKGIEHRTSITASHYALDSHAVRKREPGRVHLDGFFSYKNQPYTVPYGVMVPDAPLTNLLAPVPVSATHVGFSTLRMEPCWMALGQAAGVAAALAIDSGAAAADVDIETLQDELVDQGAVLKYDPKLWEDGVTDEQRREMQREWLEAIRTK